MKKIFKHLCLCLCLIMVGLLCFNAKPKASVFSGLSSTYNLFTFNYDEESYSYAFIFSDISPDTTGNIILGYNIGTINYSRAIFQMLDTNNIKYHNFDENNTRQEYINNNEKSFYMLLISNIFVDNNLRWKLDLIQYDYSIPWDINDETSFLNPYTLIYSYTFIADKINTIIFPTATISVYYNDYADATTLEQAIGASNYDVRMLFFLIWSYYNNQEIFKIAENLSTFYNYSLNEYNKGLDEGLELGFDLGVASIENIPGSFLTPIFDFIDNVFNLEVMPNVKIGYFIIIPLVFGVLGVVLYFWRKD